jgi:hypothetical protein
MTPLRIFLTPAEIDLLVDAAQRRAAELQREGRTTAGTRAVIDRLTNHKAQLVAGWRAAPKPADPRLPL